MHPRLRCPSLVVLILSACGNISPPAELATAPVARAHGAGCPTIRVDGSMQRFRDGDLSQTVALRALAWGPTTIALGATTNKAAEITAVDGKLWIVGPGDPVVEVHHDPDAFGGSLVSTVSPAAWAEPTPLAASSIAEIIEAVPRAADGTACADAPVIPFIVRGKASAVTWSVVGQPEGASGSTCDVDVVIVGIWSPEGRGVYVPPTLDAYLHVVIPEENVAGHLDALELLPDATLQLPERS